MTTKNPQSVPKYECINCVYKTNNKKDYSKHLATLKHQKHVQIQPLTTEYPQKIPTCYKCVYCDKIYKYRDGLWRHKKICNKNADINEPVVIHDQSNEIQEMKEFMKYLMQENSEMKNMMMEVIKSVEK